MADPLEREYPLMHLGEHSVPHIVSTVPQPHESAEVKDIATALAEAQKEFSPVAKKREATVRTNSGGTYTYKYADIADVLNMCVPVLAAHGIALMQPHILVNGRLRVCTRLLHSSGQWMMSDGVAIAESNNPQDFGTDSSYFRRYDICSFLGIAGEEDVDAQVQGRQQSQQPAVRQPQRKPTASPAQPPAGPPPASPESGLKPAASVPQQQQSSPPPPQPSTAAEEVLQKRDELIAKLKALEPDLAALGQRAKQLFPQHNSVKTLTNADLTMFYETVRKEKMSQPEETTTIPPDVASLFDDGALTTANNLNAPRTIGKGRSQRLHKIIGIHKVRTELQLEEEFLKPMRVKHASELPEEMYQPLCDWAEGKPYPYGTSVQ